MYEDLTIDELTKLAINDDVEAQAELGLRYFIGSGVERNLRMATNFFVLSGRKGNPKALTNLGLMYEFGDGVQRDFVKAFNLFKYAAEHGFAEAQCNLGTHYEIGSGVNLDLEKAVYWYQKSAEQGFARAQCNLGVMYELGRGIDADIEKAFYWYQQAANQNNGRGQFNLATMYEHGKGVERDLEKAFYWYLQSANNGYIDGQTKVGTLYEYGSGCEKDLEKCIYWYRLAANQDDARGQAFLGAMYFYGEGVEKDEKYGALLFQKSADQGFPLGQCYLGNAYEVGCGVEKDYEKAMYWYRESADQGFAESQYKIGVFYDLGFGVERDLNKAAYWYQLAANQGNASALCNLGIMYEDGDGVDIDYDKALSCYQSAANLGDPRGQCYLGTMYEKGLGVEQNYEKAIYWYELAVQRGHKLGQLYLGLMYEFGKGCEKDSEKAFQLYKLAADQELDSAQVRLGLLYEYGEGVEKDLNKAVYWYKRAADQGDYRGQCNLGIMYEFARGVEKNMDIAKNYYRLAADQNYPRAQFLLAYTLIRQDDYKEHLNEIIDLLTKASKQKFSYAFEILGNIYEEDKYGYNDYKLAFYNYKKAIENGSDCKEDLERVKDLLAGDFLHLGTRKDIFISWNHNNKDVKDELVSFLEDKGLCTVWDSDGSGIGNINEIIESAIINSKAYILLLTGNSIESEWVKEEVGMIFNQLNDHEEIKNAIIPLVLNYKVVDGKRVPFDTLKAINELSKDDPIRNVLDLTSQFAKNGIDIDYNSLEKIIEVAIEYRLKVEYRSKISEKFSTFNAALTKVVDSSNISSNIISSTLDFNNCYINRPVYDKDNNPIDKSEVLKYPLSLIYGEGGTGKTLYLKNIVRNEFKNNNYIFYLPCKDIINELENDLDFIEILKKESFDYYFPNDYKISLEGFSNLFTTNNKIIILIDALDEISILLKNKLYESIRKFINAYEDLTSLRIIFTSRNSIDGEDIASKLNTSINLFNLRGLNDEDINTIFDNINSKCNLNEAEFEGNNKNAEIRFGNSVSKEQFFISLKHISDDIKKNPLLLSNLIYVYIVTHKMPNKQFEIIQKSSELLTNTLDNDRDIKFEYGNYIKGEKLNNLLGYLTFKRSKNSNESVVDIFKNYLIKKNLIVNNDDPSVVAEEIYKYLSRRSIIIRDNVAHEIFRDYYTAVYIYNMLFTKDEDEDLCESYIRFKENYEIKLNNLINKYLHIEELPWPSVATDLLTKLDFEIYNLDTKQVIDQDNLNYDVFDEFLTKTLKEQGYSNEAINIIKGLANNELLYFTEFIKQYID